MPRDPIVECAVCRTPFVAMTEAAQPGESRCPMCQRIAPPPGRRRGIVKWYSRGKGYGFITPVDGADVFLHKSGLAAEQAPRIGQLVEFHVTHGARGAQAVDVEVLVAAANE